MLHRLLVTFAAAVVLCAPATPAPAESAQPNEHLLEGPPLTFYLAKGEPDACGDGCSEWIAGEGKFDPGAAERLRAFLKMHPGSKLPIFFSSSGGIMSEAFAIGRLLRERGMTAGVAKTIPQGCGPAGDKDEACRVLKQSGRSLAADWRPIDAACSSSCVYALLGAKERQVPPGAKLGVHSAQMIRILKVNGHVTKVVRDDVPKRVAAKSKEIDTELRRYVHEMGIDPALLEVVAKTPFEKLQFLSRDQVAGFGIDARPFLETAWTFSRLASGTPHVLKILIQAKGESAKEFRTSVFRLSCRNSSLALFAYIRGLPSHEGESLKSIKVQLSARTFAFPTKATVSQRDAIDTGASFDTRVLSVPFDVITAAAAADSIKITSADADGPADVTQISTAGLRGAIEALREACAKAP